MRAELDQHGAALRDAYTVLGEHDFLATFETGDRGAAFKSALTLRCHGLNAQTMALIDTSQFSQLVDEV